MVMNLGFLTALQDLPVQDNSKLEKALAELLISHLLDQPLTVRKARDNFSSINRLARQGNLQIIKGAPGEETVILSIKDLAAIIKAAVREMTFAEALEVSGFKPARQRIELPEGLRVGHDLAPNVKRAKSTHVEASAGCDRLPPVLT
jgi:hypothetical protein